MSASHSNGASSGPKSLAKIVTSTASSSSAHPDHGHPQVQLVFLAEFDINEGSVLKHQYPAPTGLDEHLLAEHMLPDGAHDRADDWTIFFLNQVPGLTVDSSLLTLATSSVSNDDLDTPSSGASARGSGSRKGKGRASDSEPQDGPPRLLYVMSLVRTQMDASVRRGALVKALAVATYNPYISIYRPLLMLSLDAYFKDPGIACLSRLYTMINQMETTGLPTLSLDERLILRTTERKDMFDEKFPDVDPPLNSAILRRAPSSPSLGKPIRNSSGSAEVLEASDHRSVSSGSLSSLTSKEDAAATASVDDFGSIQSRSRANTVNSTLASSIEEARGYLPSLPGANDRAGTPGLPPGRPKDTHHFDTKVTMQGKPVPIHIPLGTFPEEIGDYSLIRLIQIFSTPTALAATGPLHPHLHTSGHLTHPIILLFNALVTNKRVVFLGHGQPAGQVAGLVLAACALGSGSGSVLQGFTDRAFPYTNLTNLENLEKVPGFIAGVCNPAFADRPSWWDVLCNIETGKIVVSKDIRPASPLARSFPVPALNDDGAGGPGGKMDGKSDSPDNAFMDEITSAIQSHYGEAVIRARFTDYVQRFVRVASRYEEDLVGKTSIGYNCLPFRPGVAGQPGTLGSGVVFVDEASGAREVAMNAARIEGWRASPSYTLYQEAFRERLANGPLAQVDLPHQLSRLRQTRRMPPAEVELILRTLATLVRTDEQVVAILAHLPPHFGGLLPLAFGLFHPSETARNSTLDLLDAMSMHPTGRKFMTSLNAFHKAAYQRQAGERTARRGGL